jgi:hypothetical protein
VKCYIANSVRLRSFIRNVNNTSSSYNDDLTSYCSQKSAIGSPFECMAAGSTTKKLVIGRCPEPIGSAHSSRSMGWNRFPGTWHVAWRGTRLAWSTPKSFHDFLWDVRGWWGTINEPTPTPRAAYHRRWLVVSRWCHCYLLGWLAPKDEHIT